MIDADRYLKFPIFSIVSEQNWMRRDVCVGT